jgi:hypothetical protein
MPMPQAFMVLSSRPSRRQRRRGTENPVGLLTGSTMTGSNVSSAPHMVIAGTFFFPLCLSNTRAKKMRQIEKYVLENKVFS